MSLAPSMPMYWDAYLADTTHLTTEEHGAYLLLMAAMWRRNGFVPDDDRDNARIVGLSVQKWKAVKERLRPLLMFSDGSISQKKLLKTWESTREKIETNRANGMKGGRPKTSKNNGVAKANGSVSVKPIKTIPEPEPELTLDGASAPSKTKRGSRLPDDWTLPGEWADWAVEFGFPAGHIAGEAAKFRDYWISISGPKAVKLDWQATWRNWIRSANERREKKPYGQPVAKPHYVLFMEAERRKLAQGNGS